MQAFMVRNYFPLVFLRVRSFMVAAVLAGSLICIAQTFDQALAQEIVTTWPKDTVIVTVCHHGMRSLDAAAYFRGHGLKDVQSMRGGIDAWSLTVDSSVPRY